MDAACGRMTPAIAIPLVGYALAAGDGGLAFGVVAVLVSLVLVANLRGPGDAGANRPWAGSGKTSAARQS